MTEPGQRKHFSTVSTTHHLPLYPADSGPTADTEYMQQKQNRLARGQNSGRSGQLLREGQDGMADHDGEKRNRNGGKTKRVWVQNVLVNARLLEARLDAAHARRKDNDPAADHLEKAVRRLLKAATDAATRKDPVPGRLTNWWRGTLIEAAYQNLHAAEALIVELYDADDVIAELPEARARNEVALDRDDLRRQAIAELTPELIVQDLPRARATLGKAIEVGHAAGDHEHSRLRNFRNAVLIASVVLAILVALFIWFVHENPAQVPLCFTPAPEGDAPAMLMCPTGEYLLAGSGGPRGADVIVVALLGLMGAALAAAIAIRNLQGTSTPYDVPFALAALKLPVGVLTAIGGLLALRGDFIPGLSELDSQGQILAYALVLGYAQQLLTGYVDRQAEQLLSNAPGKETGVSRPERDLPPPPPEPPGPNGQRTDGAGARQSRPESQAPAATDGA
jgi:hypothetical protein